MERTKFEYSWHFFGIDSVLDISSLAKLPKLLHQNPIVTVSEKLIGKTFCLSSKGWIGAGSKIIAYKENLSQETYKTRPLKSLRPILNKLALIAKELQPLLLDADLQVLLYGKWLTANDQYNYKHRKLLPGKFYAFGMGIVPGLDGDVDKVKLKMQFDWNVTFCNDREKPYYLINLNLGLVKFLNSHKIKIVPVYGEFSLQHAFLDSGIFDALFRNQVSGAILVWSDGLLQWRSDYYPNQCYLGLIALEKTLEGTFTSIYNNLELVSYPFLGDQPKVDLFNKMYDVAKSKLPPLPDLQDQNKTANVYHNKIVCHMLDTCKERLSDISYFVKIKEQNNAWIFEKFKSDFVEYFPFWYK